MNKQKLLEYSSAFGSMLDEMLNDQDSRHYLDINKEVETHDTSNEFFLSMAVIHPMTAYNRMTGSSIDAIEFIEVLIRLTNQLSQSQAVESYKKSLEDVPKSEG